MFIAGKKKKENIAEYLLYMWQIEDIVRACNFDIGVIRKNVIDSFSVSEADKAQMEEWYGNIVNMMLSEGVKEHGHIRILTNTLNDLNNLHRMLVISHKYAIYTADYYKVLPLIVELRAKESRPDDNDIAVCLSFLYGMLMLRLKKTVITEETSKAQQLISAFVAKLVSYYPDYKADKLDLDVEYNN